MDVGTCHREPATTAAVTNRSLVEYTHWIYGLHALSVLIGLSPPRTLVGLFLCSLPSIIAVIMNYARRSETHGTWLEIPLPLADPHLLVSPGCGSS